MRCRISRTPEHIAQLGISKLAYYTEQKSGCKFYCWFCAQIGNKKGSYSSPFTGTLLSQIILFYTGSQMLFSLLQCKCDLFGTDTSQRLALRQRGL